MRKKNDVKTKNNAPSKESTKTLLIIFSIIYAASFAVWLIPALFALISLGGSPPPSEINIVVFLTRLFFICLILYPFFAISSMVFSWVYYQKNNFHLASKFMYIPLIYITLGFLVFLSFVVIDLYFDGFFIFKPQRR